MEAARKPIRPAQPVPSVLPQAPVERADKPMGAAIFGFLSNACLPAAIFAKHFAGPQAEAAGLDPEQVLTSSATLDSIYDKLDLRTGAPPPEQPLGHDGGHVPGWRGEPGVGARLPAKPRPSYNTKQIIGAIRKAHHALSAERTVRINNQNSRCRVTS